MSTIKLFETRQVRSLWAQDKKAWFFSIVDVVAVLTDTFARGRSSTKPSSLLNQRNRDVNLML